MGKLVIDPKLRRKWELILRKEGMGPVFPGGNNDVKNRRALRVDWTNPAAIRAGQEYFRRAGQFVYERSFQELNSRQRRIWRLHAEGLWGDQIVRKLKITRKAVRYAIDKGRKLAGLDKNSKGG